MATIDDIISWASGLPAWQGDAVRRLLVAGEQSLSAQDEDEIITFAKAALSLAPPPTHITPAPPAPGIFSGTPATAIAVQLLSIDDVQHVNIIESGKTLPFAETGVTVIYGSNGSGKSGYARILKLACNARDKEECILPNVFKTVAGGNPTTTLKIKQDGRAKAVVWTQGQATDPILTNITVFDARCARIITDERNEITYLPYGADVFGKLAALILRVKAAIETEIVNLQPLQDSGVAAETPSATFLQSLSEKIADQDINGATTWTADDEAKLAAQEELLRRSNATQAATEIEGLNKIRARIIAASTAAAEILTASTLLTNEVCEQALVELRAARQAYDAALAERKTEEPLLGVASTDQWKILYDAAKRYSEEVAYRDQSFPNIATDALCVLCQQPLKEDAIARFGRFKKFMEDVTAAVLRAKRQALRELREQFEALTPWSGATLESICDELTSRDPAAGSAVRAFHESVTARKIAVLELLKEQENEAAGKASSLIPVAAPPQAVLQAIAEQITQKVAEITNAAKPDEFKKLQTEVVLVKSRKALNTRKADIVAYVAKAKRNAAIRKATAELRTQEITRQGTALIRRNLTPELLGFFNAELTELGATRIPISMRPTGAVGEAQHELLLEGAHAPARTQISQILSEGEVRVIAIAGFLAELQLSQQSNPIVFDDPVSSLDHVFTGKIAARLACEGLKRQVIVFTHNIAFLMELQDAAEALAKQGTPVGIAVQTLRRRGSVAGVTTNGAPWHALKVTQRAHHLEQAVAKIKAQYNNDMELYNREAARIYGLLREAWESCVEDDLLYAVVCRYRNSVKTQQLSEVSIEDPDIHLIDLHTSKCGTWMTGHDKSKALNEDRPAPDEVMADIKALRDFSGQIKQRRDDTRQRRKAQLRVL